MERIKPYCTFDQLSQVLSKADLWDELVQKALERARRSHRNDYRDDGQPYLTQHVFPLTLDVYNYFVGTAEAKTAVIVTLLHDVPEKDRYYDKTRLEVDFGKEIADLVMCLVKPVKNTQIRTQQDRHDEQVEFMKKIELSPTLCKVIKVLDRNNNLACTDVARDPLKYERFVQDTRELYLPLAQKIDKKLATAMEEETARIFRELHT